MAIRLKYEAAGVPASAFSNEKTRDNLLGLVQQRQQMAQRDKELGFNAYNQNQRLMAEDFDNASDRIDGFAKEALNNSDLPQEVRQQIQNSLAGKIAVLGGGFDQSQRQQYLRQHNARLGGLLSELPARTPQPKMQQPKSVDEALLADPKALNDDYKSYLNNLTEGGVPNEQQIAEAWDLAKKAWEIRNGLRTPATAAPKQPAAPGSAAPATTTGAASMQPPQGGMQQPALYRPAGQSPGMPISYQEQQSPQNQWAQVANQNAPQWSGQVTQQTQLPNSGMMPVAYNPQQGVAPPNPQGRAGMVPGPQYPPQQGQSGNSLWGQAQGLVYGGAPQQTPQPPQVQTPQAPPQVQGGMPPVVQPQAPAPQQAPAAPQQAQTPQQAPIDNWKYPQQGGGVVDPQRPLNPVQEPTGALNVATGFASLPEGQRQEFARRGATRGMTEQQAFEYAQKNPWAGIPDEMKKKYEANFAKGGTTMTPQQAARYYWENHYTKSPEKHQKALAAEGGARYDANVASAQKELDDVKNLAKTGVADYSDYNYKTDIKNKRTAENNASMQAELERQQAGGGLKYRPSSPGFGTGEQASQAASDFNSMAAAEQAKKDAYNQKQDGVMDQHKSQMDEWREATDAAFKEGKTLQQYIKDGIAAGTIKKDSYVAKHAAKIYDGRGHGSASDLAKLTAEYNVFQKANKPSDRMKFKDWVAQKNAKTPIDGKVLAQIEATYGPISPAEDTAGYDTGSANRDQWRDSRQAAREEKKQGRKYGGQQAQSPQQAQGGLPPTAAGQPQSSVPDFDNAIANAGDDVDRTVISGLKGIYQTAKPDVQNAISVFVSPSSTDSQRAQASIALRKAGIDLDRLVGSKGI